MLATAARSLVQAASDRRVYSIDFFADEDTVQGAVMACAVPPSLRYQFNRRRLAPALHKITAAAGSMPIIIGSGFENNPATVAWLQRDYELLGTAAPQWARIKALPTLLHELAQRQHIKIPVTSKTRPATTQEWLVKHCGRSGGFHVYAAAQEQRPTRSAYFQRRIAGPSLSATYIGAAGHSVLVGVAQHLRYLGADCFQHQGLVALSDIDTRLLTQIRSLGERVCDELPLTGLFGLDFLLDSDGELCLVDINPRPPASIDVLPQAHHLIRAHIDACRSQTLLYSSPRSAGCRGFVVIYAERAWRVPTQFEWPTGAADRPAQGSLIKAGQPLCSLHAEGPDLTAVLATLTAINQRLAELTDQGSPGVVKKNITIQLVGGNPDVDA